MDSMRVTGITVSLELKHTTYGVPDAENRFVSLKAESPDGAAGLTIEDAITKSLEFHLGAWESLYAAELAAGRMKSDEFNARRTKVKARFAKLKTFLQENPE